MQSHGNDGTGRFRKTRCRPGTTSAFFTSEVVRRFAHVLRLRLEPRERLRIVHASHVLKVSAEGLQNLFFAHHRGRALEQPLCVGLEHVRPRLLRELVERIPGRAVVPRLTHHALKRGIVCGHYLPDHFGNFVFFIGHFSHHPLQKNATIIRLTETAAREKSMASTETADALFAQVTFSSTDPVVIYNRNGNVAGVARSSAGVYVIDLVNKLGSAGTLEPSAQVLSSVLSGAASFAQASPGAGGDITVQTRNLAGALADTGGRVEVLCLKYPTTG
jgi:hypothetical protein